MELLPIPGIVATGAGCATCLFRDSPSISGSSLAAGVAETAHAYAESLSGVEYLRQRYGMGEVIRMLRNIGSGAEPEMALRQSTGMDYSTFEQRLGEYLAKAGGD